MIVDCAIGRKADNDSHNAIVELSADCMETVIVSAHWAAADIEISDSLSKRISNMPVTYL